MNWGQELGVTTSLNRLELVIKGIGTSILERLGHLKQDFVHLTYLSSILFVNCATLHDQNAV